MEVRFTSLRLLEPRTGPSSRPMKCCRAWPNQLESGIDSTSEMQIANARLWREAWEHAIGIATPPLGQPQTTFRFELFPRQERQGNAQKKPSAKAGLNLLVLSRTENSHFKASQQNLGLHALQPCRTGPTLRIEEFGREARHPPENAK